MRSMLLLGTGPHIGVDRRRTQPTQWFVPPPGGVMVFPPSYFGSGAAHYIRPDGTIGDAMGTTTAGIQEAINWLLENYGGGTVYLGAGNFVVTTAIDFYTGSTDLTAASNKIYPQDNDRVHLAIVGTGPYSTVISTASEVSVMDFDWGRTAGEGGSYAGVGRFTLRDFSIAYTGTTHSDSNPLMRLNMATTRSSLENLEFSSNGYARLCALEIDTCWEVYCRALRFANLRAIKTSADANSGNLSIDGATFTGSVGLDLTGGSTFNSVLLTNPKFIMSGSQIARWPDHLRQTFSGLTAGQKATFESGSTAIYVGTGHTMNVNQMYVCLVNGNGSELVRVTNYDSVNGELDLGTALVNDYTANSALSVEVIYGGSIAVFNGDTTPAITMINPHFEGCTAGVFTNATTVIQNGYWGTSTLSNALSQGEEYGAYATSKGSAALMLLGGSYDIGAGRSDDKLVYQMNDWDASGNVGGVVHCIGMQGYSGGSFFPYDLDEVVTFDSGSTRRFGVGDTEMVFNRSTLTFSASAAEVDFSGDVHVDVDLEVTQRAWHKGGYVCEPREVSAGTSINGSTDYVLHVDTSAAAGATSHNLPGSPLDGQKVLIKDVGGSASTKNVTLSGNGNNIEGAGSKIIQSDYGMLWVQYSISQTQWYILNSIGTIA